MALKNFKQTYSAAGNSSVQAAANVGCGSTVEVGTLLQCALLLIFQHSCEVQLCNAELWRTCLEPVPHYCCTRGTIMAL